MSDDLGNGGAAFPHVNPNYDGNWDKEPQRGGMSLRDYFAAAALAYHIPRPGDAPRDIADRAYTIADAMLTARGASHG